MRCRPVRAKTLGGLHLLFVLLALLPHAHQRAGASWHSDPTPPRLKGLACASSTQFLAPVFRLPSTHTRLKESSNISLHKQMVAMMAMSARCLGAQPPELITSLP